MLSPRNRYPLPGLAARRKQQGIILSDAALRQRLHDKRLAKGGAGTLLMMPGGELGAEGAAGAFETALRAARGTRAEGRETPSSFLASPPEKTTLRLPLKVGAWVCLEESPKEL